MILGIVKKAWGRLAALALVATATVAAAAVLVPDKSPAAAVLASATVIVVAAGAYARDRRQHQIDQAREAERTNLLRRAVFREVRGHHYSLFLYLDSVAPAMLVRKYGSFVEQDESFLGQLSTRSLEAVAGQTLGRDDFEHFRLYLNEVTGLNAATSRHNAQFARDAVQALAHGVQLADEMIKVDGVVVGDELREEVARFDEMRPNFDLMWGLIWENYSDLSRYRDWKQTQSSGDEAGLRRFGLWHPEPPVQLPPELASAPDSAWLPYLTAAEALRNAAHD